MGYGGSCFPKDVRALAALARTHGIEPRVLDAVHAVNEHQKTVLVEKIEQHFAGKLSDKAIAIWGLAFKPGTDDIREAPALVLIDRLLALRATVRVYDPEAMDNVRAIYGDRLVYCQKRDDALLGADALAICTEWKQFVHPGFRGDAAVDAAAGDLRRPQPLQSPADARGRLHLLQHRPAGGRAAGVMRGARATPKRTAQLRPDLRPTCDGWPRQFSRS